MAAVVDQKNPTGAHLAASLDEELAVGRVVLAPPGHKRNPKLVGGTPLEYDITLLAGVESLAKGGRLLREAERAAARCWRADAARFSVAGASFANHVALLAAAPPGSRVLVSRMAHKSVLAGLVLAGHWPLWVMPDAPLSDLLTSAVPDDAFAAALRTNYDIRAAVVTEPTYAGRLSGIEQTVAECHSRGIPLVVDQAWGAHFGFHPNLPPSALSMGADVVVLSVHKTLTASSQGALLLMRDSPRLSVAFVDNLFDLLATTSPSVAVQASLDRARELAECHGERLLDAMLRDVASIREELDGIAGVRVLSRGLGWDPSKLVVEMVSGHSGVEVAETMRCWGVQVAGADASRLIAVATVADDLSSLRRFVGALRRATGAPSRCGRPPVAGAELEAPEVVLSPRDAYFAPDRHMPFGAAEGRISAEAVMPYPPGVPMLMPGEVVTRGVLQALRAARESGLRIIGAADPTLATVRVVA